jgi:WD40 repeat protein
VTKFAVSFALLTNQTEKKPNKIFIKVWDSQTGTLVSTLVGHENKVFIMERHPYQPNLLLTGAYDGLVILWDIFLGEMLQKFRSDPMVPLCDGKFSPDGKHFAIVDKNGQVTILRTRFTFPLVEHVWRDGKRNLQRHT